MRNQDRTNIRKTIIFSICSILIILLLFMSFYIVNPGERAVLLTFGKPDKIAFSEGLHFKIPLAQKAVKLDVKTTKIEVDAASSSKDLQIVSATIALNYHLSPEETPLLYQEIGKQFEERIIIPAVQETVKAVTARFTAEELITKRQEVRIGIQEELKERLSKSYIIVDDFNIVNFDFSEEFNNAIEAKVTAEQLKLKAERDLERIEIEAKQVITQAEAEAKALTLKNQAIKDNQEVVKLKMVEAQLLAISKWDGILPKITGDSVPLIQFNQEV